LPVWPPSPPGETAAPDISVDAFHKGRFHLVQPARGGHRAGMDALVLAAAVPSSFAGQAADFGAGAGAVGLAVAARCPMASLLLVEKSPEMAAYARRSLGLEANRHLADRISLLTADVTAPASARDAAGLSVASADFVVMNPPFNDAIDRATPDDLKRTAHVMDADLFEAWLRTAASVARPRAGLAIIARPVSLAPILAAMGRRFGGAEIIAVHARAARPAIRIVVRARRGARGGLSLLPPLVLQQDDGRTFTQRAEAINCGQASLFGD